MHTEVVDKGRCLTASCEDDGRLDVRRDYSGFKSVYNSIRLEKTVRYALERKSKGTNLGIYMFQSPHDDSSQRVVLLVLFIHSLRAAYRTIQALLILEPVDVLRAVRVDVLQALRKLVVEAVHEADDAAADAHDAVLLALGRALRELVVVLRGFLDGVRGLLRDDRDELVDLALRGDPELDRHVRRDGRVVVEARGDERQQHADALVRRHRDLEQPLEDADLLRPVGVLQPRSDALRGRH